MTRIQCLDEIVSNVPPQIESRVLRKFKPVDDPMSVNLDCVIVSRKFKGVLVSQDESNPKEDICDLLLLHFPWGVSVTTVYTDELGDELDLAENGTTGGI